MVLGNKGVSPILQSLRGELKVGKLTRHRSTESKLGIPLGYTGSWIGCGFGWEGKNLGAYVGVHGCDVSQRVTSQEKAHIGSPLFLETIIAGGHKHTGVDCSAGRAEENVGVPNFGLDDAANRR